MNEAMLALVNDAVARVQRAILELDCPAVVILEGPKRLILSDYDYLRDHETAAAFEQRAAKHALELPAARWAFAVPLVWAETATEVSVRAVSNQPLRAGEQETITWLAFDAASGVDYGRVPYTRRPDGEPIFGDLEMVNVAVIPHDDAPGRILLGAITES